MVAGQFFSSITGGCLARDETRSVTAGVSWKSYSWSFPCESRWCRSQCRCSAFWCWSGLGIDGSWRNHNFLQSVHAPSSDLLHGCSYGFSKWILLGSNPFSRNNVSAAFQFFAYTEQLDPIVTHPCWKVSSAWIVNTILLHLGECLLKIVEWEGDVGWEWWENEKGWLLWKQSRLYSSMEWGCANSKRITSRSSIPWFPTGKQYCPTIFPSSSISSFKQTHKSQVYESGSGMYTFISSVSVFKANLHMIPYAAHSLHSAPVVSLRFEPLHQIKLGCRWSVLLLVHSNVFQNLSTIKP